MVDAPNGMDYVFLGKTLPFDRVSGKLTFTNDRLQLADLRANHADVLKGIRESRDFSDDSKKALSAALDKFTKTFA